MESVELLLYAGAVVNVKNDYGVTPLSLAADKREPAGGAASHQGRR